MITILTNNIKIRPVLCQPMTTDHCGEWVTHDVNERCSNGWQYSTHKSCYYHCMCAKKEDYFAMPLTTLLDFKMLSRWWTFFMFLVVFSWSKSSQFLGSSDAFSLAHTSSCPYTQSWLRTAAVLRCVRTGLMSWKWHDSQWYWSGLHCDAGRLKQVNWAL